LIGGSDGVVKPPGTELGLVLGEVFDDGALDDVLAGDAISSTVVLGKLVAALLASAGGGVALALVGGGDAFVCGETATTSGAIAPLCPTGLTAEPTRTPNASNAITATPETAGDRPASAPPVDAPAAASASPP
jgi:hypothetical protein